MTHMALVESHPRTGWRTVRVALAVVTASGLTFGLQLSGASSAAGEEPRISVKAGKPDAATGSVRIRVSVSEGCYDGFGDFPRDICWNDDMRPRLRIPESTDLGRITAVRWKGLSGSLTYTPTATARHKAASETATTAEKRDRFNITVIDQNGNSQSAQVGVLISPQNTTPTATPVVGLPDAQGVVTGNIGATDVDGDVLKYSVTTPPVKGSVVVAQAGAFTYTPRLRRSSVANTGGTDSFVVTVSDGYGGSVNIPITCPDHP
jgi:hypothetical protein